MADRKYVPALSLRALTPFYDLLVERPSQSIRKDMIAELGDLNGKKILDVGSGTGSLTIHVKNRFPLAEVKGVDGDP